MNQFQKIRQLVLGQYARCSTSKIDAINGLILQFVFARQKLIAHRLQHAFAVGRKGGAKVKITITTFLLAEGHVHVDSRHRAKIMVVAARCDEFVVRAYFVKKIILQKRIFL